MAAVLGLGLCLQGRANRRRCGGTRGVPPS